MEIPARTLKDVFNACDPTRALDAGDRRYVNLAAGRGQEGGAVAKCRKRILLAEEPLTQLFAGHRGCGKSTELRRLQQQLEDEGYFVMFIDSKADLDLEDTEIPDILLMLVRQVDLALREAGIEISENLLEEFAGWFAEVLIEKTQHSAIGGEIRSEVEAGGGVPLLGRLLARFSGWIKTGTESKRQLRQKLDAQISQLLDRGRGLIDEARRAVRDHGHEDLVLIVDSLDRIALRQLGDDRTTHDVLFIERGELLRELGVHTVYTVPISLLLSAKLENLTAIFPHRHVLPMVKIAERGTREPWPTGRDLMRQMLEQRVVMGEVFEDGAVDELVTGSGGHPRHLLTLIHYALDFVDELPIDGGSARRAVQRMANDYGRSIPEEHWTRLAGVYRTQTVRNDSEHQAMLFNLSVLEYQNDERWCDVHPTVPRLDAFQKALDDLSPRDDA